MIFVAVAVGLVVVALLLRAWLLHAESPLRHHEPFDGVVYRVGEAHIGERRSQNPRATVICMHGFLEDLRHFVDHYADPELQLIVLASGGYHVPISKPEFREAPWSSEPAHPHGSIAYDAAVLCQALEHLPKTRNIRVHGHSRGGAVALEAASMRPDLFADVEVILEAPVLPEAKTYRSLSPLEIWAMPLVVPLWRLDPMSPFVTRGLGPLEHPRKRHLMTGLPFSTVKVATMVAGVQDIERWMRSRDASLYKNLRRGHVLVPKRDRVLDAGAMLASARKGSPPLQVIEVESCSHFILHDRPDAVPPLLEAP